MDSLITAARQLGLHLTFLGRFPSSSGVSSPESTDGLVGGESVADDVRSDDLTLLIGGGPIGGNVTPAGGACATNTGLPDSSLLGSTIDGESLSDKLQDGGASTQDLQHGHVNIQLLEKPGADFDSHENKRASESSRGFELGAFSPSIFPTLFQQQSENWEIIVGGYVVNVIGAVHRFCYRLPKYLCSEERIMTTL